MTGTEYANLVASYVSRRFGARALKVYREIRVGKTIIGKNRCIDIFCVARRLAEGVRDRVQVPGQPGHGGREDSVRARRPARAADGRLHRLRGPGLLRRRAAHARRVAPRGVLPAGRLARPRRRTDTRELDHVLAVHFGWWDVLIEKKRPV